MKQEKIKSLIEHDNTTTLCFITAQFLETSGLKSMLTMKNFLRGLKAN